METMIQFQNVSKSFDKKQVLNNLSFQLSGKKVIGLLGPNGAGKSTLIHLILGLIQPTTGEVFVNNRNAWLHREELSRQIGVVLESPKFYSDLSATGNLTIFSKLLECSPGKIQEVLERVDLKKAGNTIFQNFSLGMKQRLSLALCLLKDTEILIFDEPTNGLDPEGIYQIRSLIQSLTNEGKLCILSSHLLSEVEQSCSEIILLKNGELIDHFQFGSNHKKGNVRYKISSDDLQSLSNYLQKVPEVSIKDISNKSITIELSLEYGIGVLNKKLCDNNILLTEISPKGTLEEIVMEKLNVKD